MANEISPIQDIIDSREVISRLEELEEIKETIEELTEQLEELDEDVGEEAEDLRAEIESYEKDFEDCEEEYMFLVALKEAFEGYGDWEYGEEIINDDYFADFAKQFAEEIYDLPDSWPANHIDWEAAADALKEDYMSVDIANVGTFWMRS